MKIKINVLFWNNEKDGQRLKNVKLCWHYLKLFCEEANKQGLNIEPFLFDFSEKQILGDAMHMPYPKGVYKRAEKINRVLSLHGVDEYNDYIFSVMDSDLIINPKDYNDLIYLLKNIANQESFKQDKFYVFNLNDLKSLKGVDFENNNINFEELEYEQRSMEADLGALFFIHHQLLKYIGGFDTRFKIWSCEDNAASYKLQHLGYKKRVLPIKPFHLPHVNLMYSTMGTKEYNEQVQLLDLIRNGRY